MFTVIFNYLNYLNFENEKKNTRMGKTNFSTYKKYKNVFQAQYQIPYLKLYLKLESV